MDASMDYNNFSYVDYYYNISECQNASLVVCRLGAARDPLSTVIPMTIVYTVILMTGVTGNICTCIVIYRNRYMHTATNYYLFSLAVSDLLLLVLGLPQELYQLWYKYPYIFGESFCILRGLTSEMSTNASILTITAFTVERYLAICHPIRAHTMSKLSRAVKCVLIIWAAAAVAALPTAVQFGIEHQVDLEGKEIPESAQCSIIRPLPHTFECQEILKLHKIHNSISTGLFFVVPILIISVLYVLIGLRLRKATLGRDINAHQIQQAKSRKAVVKMLVAVVTSFFICWTPFHAQRLLAIYTEEVTPALIVAFTILTYISGVTYYLSATLNPILYQLLSGNFRQAFKDTFGCRRISNKNDLRSSHQENSRYRVSHQVKVPLDSTASWVSNASYHHDHT